MQWLDFGRKNPDGFYRNAIIAEPLPTIMKKCPYVEGLYEVDIGLTLLFSQIYGEDEYYRFKENATLSDYKNQFNKLILTIEKSFKDSCRDTDQFHQSEIEKLIKYQVSSIKKSKSIEELFQSLVIFFPKFCFLIIGRIPQNYSKRKKDNRSNWDLTEFRQLEYKQSNTQRFELIMDLLKNDRIEELGSYKEVMDEFHSSSNKNKTFLDWFKGVYPKIYIDLLERTE